MFKVKKIVSVFLVLAIMIGVSVTALAATGGWTKEGNDWYYTNSSGKTVKNEWVKDDVSWYWLKADGKMAASETLTIDGKSYTFGSSGAWVVPPPQPVADILRNKETRITAKERTVIERDRYILTIPAGYTYSDLTIPLYDRIMDIIEHMTGMSFITDTHKNKLRIGIDDSEGISYAGMNGEYFNIESRFLDVREYDTVYTFAHEALHAIHFRNYDGIHGVTTAIAEGFVGLFEWQVEDAAYNPRKITYVLEKDEVEMIRYVINNRFGEFLEVRYDRYKPITGSSYFRGDIYIGNVFFVYIYETFGMKGVRAVLDATGKGGNKVVNSINKALGTDIVAGFQKWYAENENVRVFPTYTRMDANGYIYWGD